MSRRPEPVRQAGVTITELVVVVAVLGFVFGMVVSQARLGSGGLKSGSDQIVSVTRLARASAMSTTTPHRVIAASETSVAIAYGGPCGDLSATWTTLDDSETELPVGIRFADATWDVCFNTRGWTTDVHEIRLLEGAAYQDVSVLLGGSVRVGDIHRQP